MRRSAPQSHRARRFRSIGPILLLASLAQCTSRPNANDAAADADSRETSVVVGVGRLRIPATQGGRLRSADGLFELYVPPGAIAEDTEFSVTKLEGAAVPAEVAAAQPASGVYSVEPDGLRFLGNGAYAQFTIPTVPEGVISNDSPPEYRSMEARTRAASGGPIEPEPESNTVFAYGTRGARVIARCEHLSIKFASSELSAHGVHIAADLSDRTIDVGPHTSYATRIGFRNGRGLINIDPTQQAVGVSVAVAAPLVAVRGQTSIPSGAVEAFGVSSHLTEWSNTPLGPDQVAWAMPPPTVFCTGPLPSNSFLLLTQAQFVLPAQPRGRRFLQRIMLEGIVHCVPGAPPFDGGVLDARTVTDDTGPPRDATGDVSLDAPFDSGERDVVAADATVDSTMDASGADRDCPGVVETRCSGVCVDLANNVDHCGACNNVCPMRSAATRECSMGSCRNRCIANYGDCDGNVDNGCETNLTRPGNCGGCGRMPMELCNGVDDDCDGTVDEGCPNGINWPLADTAFGPNVGGMAVGDGSSTAGNFRENPIIGLCGGLSPMGGIRSIRPVLGAVVLFTDRAMTPYRYSLVITEIFPGGVRCEDGTGGGSSGGTPYAIRCPAGMLAEGIVGQAMDNVGQIQLQCASWSAQQNAMGAWVIRRSGSAMSPPAGTSPGTPFTWLVPDDATTMNPGALRNIDFRYSLGTDAAVLRMRPSGVSPTFRTIF